MFRSKLKQRGYPDSLIDKHLMTSQETQKKRKYREQFYIRAKFTKNLKAKLIERALKKPTQVLRRVFKKTPCVGIAWQLQNSPFKSNYRNSWPRREGWREPGF